MKTKVLIKKSVALIICLSVAVCSLCFAPTALAAEEYQGENLDVPQIRVTTENGNGCELQKEDGYVSASISIKDTDGKELTDAISFKVRGNTTALSWVNKKAFTFKFAKKKNVLGMGSGKKWFLIANAFDPPLLRNYTAFELARELGLEYTSNQKFCELWVDGSFRGCYVLYEPVQEGKDRVNIDIESNGGKKDFLLELEAVTQEDDVTYLKTDNNKIRFAFTDPEEPNEEQQAYVQGIMDDIVERIKSGVREDIEEKVDLQSFAKYYLLNEYLKTFDFERTSVYFYYKDGKLYAGPAWDYDLSTGNERAEFSYRSLKASETDGIFANKNLFVYLAQYGWFNNMVSDTYKEHYAFLDDIAADNGFLDSTYEQYRAVFDRNYNEAGWNISKWWVNHIRKPSPTYAENYDYLKNWCADRQTWMTEYFKPFGEKYILGDADNNGVVTVSDVTRIQRIIAEIETDDDNTAVRGIISGNKLDADDALDIQKYIAKYKNNKNIGCELRY